MLRSMGSTGMIWHTAASRLRQRDANLEDIAEFSRSQEPDDEDEDTRIRWAYRMRGALGRSRQL
jgi:hypothetical protein